MFNWFKDAGVGKKILVAVLSLVILGSGFIMFFTAKREIESVKEAAIHEARAIVLQAESVRNLVADLNDKGAFSAYVDSVKQELRENKPGALGKFLATVPVVSSMVMLQANAEEGGYMVRVPKVQPRNPENQPDSVELETLNKLRASGASESIVLGDYMNPTTGKKSYALRYFRPIILTKVCETCHGDPADSVKYWGTTDGSDPTGVRMENWRAGEMHGAFELIYFLDEHYAAMTQSQIIMGALIFVGMVIMVLIVGFITKSIISDPLSNIIRHAEHIAQGDFREDLKADYGGEMGQLSKAFSAMKQGLTNLLSGVQKETRSVNDAADQLLDNSKKLSEQSTFAKERATEAASTSLEASKDINSIASAVEDFSIASQEIASNVAHAASISNTAKSRMDEASSQVLKLGDNSTEIGKAVQLISEIAEQTNLLALNATIEAARAGEAGKGFAVVANEVKELAKQTAQAAEEITSMIQVIQNDTSQTVSSIGDVTSIIEQLNDIDNTIASAVEEQTATVNEITANISGAAQGTENVSETVDKVSEVSGDSAQNASQAKIQAEKLAELASRLQELTQSFKF